MKKSLASALLVSACFTIGGGGIASTTAVAADSFIPTIADGLSGVVTGPRGPEAGVWVIAETGDLQTRFIKIVVTDDLGRYVLPELPQANYKIWVRGYGLVDSKPVQSQPGKRVDLTAAIAPDARSAAQYYPANYWYALTQPPAASEFPGTGPKGNGIGTTLTNQQMWLDAMKRCLGCHQTGTLATRELAENNVEGWSERIKQARALNDPVVGNLGPGYAYTMGAFADMFGRERMLKMFADWTARIAAGEVPPEPPPRPSGVERNIVLTEWDWASGSFVHDDASTDRRNPTANANGLVYGTETNVGKIAFVDPTKNAAGEIAVPNGQYIHDVTLDGKGRAWFPGFTDSFMKRKADDKAPPNECKDEWADRFANGGAVSARIAHMHMLDPTTKKITTLLTCLGTYPAHAIRPKDDVLFFSGDTVVNWVDTTVWDETHDTRKAQGWCPAVLSTKEDQATRSLAGDREALPDESQWNELGKPLDPRKDTWVGGFFKFGAFPNPKDGSVWFTADTHSASGGIVRVELGAHPPQTCKAEYYEPPKLPNGTYAALYPYKLDFDSNGVAWVTFNSATFASFDRSKCKVRSGPTATGQHCPEGWNFHDQPGPRIGGSKEPADWNYGVMVDRHDMFGLGRDVPMVTGSNSDALLAMIPKTGAVVTMRVPYPMSMYTRWIDGRIDDPKTGWKGRGLWATFSTIPVWHQEGGTDDRGPELVKFQLRPDPLAH